LLGDDGGVSDLLNFDENSIDPLLIGEVNIAKIQSLVGIVFPVSEVYIYPGAIKHIKREHAGIWELYGHLLPSIVQEPDYIGKNPKVPNSIELYKQLGDHMLLAIKLDPTGYLFVSSLYELNNAIVKIKKRLASGRIVAYV
jgi:hypothetical protein